MYIYICVTLYALSSIEQLVLAQAAGISISYVDAQDDKMQMIWPGILKQTKL